MLYTWVTEDGYRLKCLTLFFQNSSVEVVVDRVSSHGYSMTERASSAMHELRGA